MKATHYKYNDMIKHFQTTTIEYDPETGEYERRDIDCDHKFVLVLFGLDNGNTQLRNYCKKCHYRTPQPLKQSEYNLKDVPKRKEANYKAFIEARWEEDKPEVNYLINRLNEIIQCNYIQGHKDYINSDEWKELRDKVLKRDNFTCQICGGEAHHVHHLTYAHFKDEYFFELVALCKDCHKREYHSHSI